MPPYPTTLHSLPLSTHFPVNSPALGVSLYTLISRYILYSLCSSSLGCHVVEIEMRQDSPPTFSSYSPNDTAATTTGNAASAAYSA
ncbi:unnamed protein product [Taenia asiatica]|uniref:Uncharacterized protein n=1 Tax=Taenia asiatica TaxID=60517 RepID=A0A0R3VZX4_TAEAS|nr:unnamed protein product [Taenia asiatica]